MQFITLALLSLLITAGQAAEGPGGNRPGATAAAAHSGATAFVENRGQWNTPARFVGRFGAVSVLVEPGAIGLQLPEPGHPERGAYVRLRLVSPSVDCRIEGEQRLPGIESFFLGNDPKRWATGLSRWGQVRMSCAWEGVDLVLREQGGQLEYDVEVAPGVDLDVVQFEVEGCESLMVDEGRLGLPTSVGLLWQQIPACWQVDQRDVRTMVEGLWLPLGPTRFGLHVPERHADSALVVDPQIVWGTYIGSVTGEDTASGLARAPNGDYVLTGNTSYSGAFPSTPGAYQHPGGTSSDVVVVRLDGNQATLVYSSVIGGWSGEIPGGVSLDQWGGPIVVGYTFSNDFPTTPGAFDPVMHALDTAAFVLRLSPMADQLIYSTFIESPGVYQGGHAFDVAATADGAAIVVGRAYDGGFPTTPGSYDPTFNGIEDAFVLRLDPTGSRLDWSTFLGGATLDDAYGVVLDDREAPTIVGQTGSPTFPTTPGAYSPAFFPPPGQLLIYQAFVTRLSPRGDALEWSTFLGGSDNDRAYSVALDADGGVLVGGDTLSPDFPVTPGVPQSSLNPLNPQLGIVDGFVARLDTTGSYLVYGTYLGGSVGDETVLGIAADASGVVTVTGGSGGGIGFPVTPGAYNWTAVATWDFYLTRLAPHGELLYSTFVGSPVAEDRSTGAVRDPDGGMTVTGYTIGPGFPTTPGVFGPSYFGGGRDITVARLDLLYEGVELLGASTPSCRGPLEAQASEWPLAGAVNFSLWCSQAPPMSSGFLLIGSPATSPTNINGVAVWLATNRPIRRIPVITDGYGWVRTNVDLTNAQPGRRLTGQFLIRNTPTCGNQSWCASNAVNVTVQ